jgi:hypothetical protein
MMNLFPADGGLNPVLVNDECLDFYEQHLTKRWKDNLYSLGHNPLGSTIEQAERQETIDALKVTNKSDDSNPNPKKNPFPSPKKGKCPEKTVHTTDKKSKKYCLIHGQW